MASARPLQPSSVAGSQRVRCSRRIISATAGSAASMAVSSSTNRSATSVGQAGPGGHGAVAERFAAPHDRDVGRAPGPACGSRWSSHGSKITPASARPSLHRVEDQEVVDPAHAVGGGAGLDLGVDAVGLEVEAPRAQLVGGDEPQLAGGRHPDRDRAAPQVVHGPDARAGQGDDGAGDVLVGVAHRPASGRRRRS